MSKSPVTREQWFSACEQAAALLSPQVPDCYRSRTFSGIIGDIKALPSRKALSLYTRKKGLGLQYAVQYLATGIDRGRGYQACAATALADVLNGTNALNRTVIPAKAVIHSIHPAGTAHCDVHCFDGRVLDVGCAVGVTAGILELERVTGFDLFPDLVRAAASVDRIAGKRNVYVVADMNRDWPFGQNFDAVVAGLVCHHLKTQAEVASFFRNANRVLVPGGSLVLTFPAGSIATARILETICRGLETFGFGIDEKRTGLVRSTDDTESLFWMFVICASKQADAAPLLFIDDSFSFLATRTPVTREEKAEKARITVMRERNVLHKSFRLITLAELLNLAETDEPLTFEMVSSLYSPPRFPSLTS
jgi:SAM-dependent methyltransferase